MTATSPTPPPIVMPMIPAAHASDEVGLGSLAGVTISLLGCALAGRGPTPWQTSRWAQRVTCPDDGCHARPDSVPDRGMRTHLERTRLRTAEVSGLRLGRWHGGQPGEDATAMLLRLRPFSTDAGRRGLWLRHDRRGGADVVRRCGRTGRG
jgi:hypothetical protein